MNVAVIETEVDPHSGAAAELTPAGGWVGDGGAVIASARAGV
jgi:hypothetical protein